MLASRTLPALTIQVYFNKKSSSDPTPVSAILNNQDKGHLGGSAVEHLPSAQGVILGSWDQVPHQTPCMEPASPSAYVSASLCVSLMNK